MCYRNKNLLILDHSGSPIYVILDVISRIILICTQILVLTHLDIMKLCLKVGEPLPGTITWLRVVVLRLVVSYIWLIIVH